MGARIRRVKYTVAADVIDLVLRATPLLDGHGAPPAFINYAGGGDFVAVGNRLVASLRERCALRDGDRVLDIGCGIGRAASALQRAGTEIGYDGFDLVRYGITWCRKRFRDDPRFRFVHADIHNAFYNPRGTVAAEDYRFPYPDGVVDLAFATSVFTHMRAPEVRRYLQEIRRCLGPGGRAYVTCFLLDGDARAEIGAGRSCFTFGHRMDEAWTESPGEPELAVALDPSALTRDLMLSGLEVAAFHPGAWRGIEAEEFQDAYVLRPRARGETGT